MSEYWEERYDLMYYSYVRYFVRVVGAQARSLVDVGSHGADYITWFDWIPSLTSLDLNRPYVGEGVVSIKSDFFKWTPPEAYDVALCLQVLEHLDRPDLFMKKIFSISRQAVISVPYEWPEGSSVHHVQDPVTLEKLAGWAGREPNYYQIVTEPFSDRYSPKSRRLVAYYDVRRPDRVVSGGEVKRRQLVRSIPVSTEPAPATPASAGALARSGSLSAREPSTLRSLLDRFQPRNRYLRALRSAGGRSLRKIGVLE